MEFIGCGCDNWERRLQPASNLWCCKVLYLGTNLWYNVLDEEWMSGAGELEVRPWPVPQQWWKK
jgi:hypothetical protein